MKLKIGDLIVFAVVVFFILLSINFSNKNPLKYVKIITPYKTLIYPLKKDIIFTVKGKIGFLKIEIKNHKVRVLSSSCPNKICVKTGWLSTSNGYIACVPNGVLIKLIGATQKSNIDFITQ